MSFYPQHRVRMELLKRGGTIVDLGLNIGLDPSQLSKILKGKLPLTPEVKRDIARELDRPENELFD